MKPSVEFTGRWRVSGCGEARGLHYISVWRYGVAAHGEPSVVSGTEWFASATEHVNRLRQLGVFVGDETSAT